MRTINKILYVGRVGLPNTAPGIRIFNMAKLLQSIGYEVEFLCDQENSNEIEEYSGFCYYFAPVKKTSKIQVLKNIAELVLANNIYKRVVDYCNEKQPKAVFLYNDLYGLTRRLIPYAKKNNIKLIADATEWYEKKKTGRFAEKLIPYLVDRRIRKLDCKLDGIIAISPYLYNYYTKLGSKSIFIPPIFEINETFEISKYNYYKHKTINLVYAGTIGDKDLIIPILNVLKSINTNEVKIRLDIVGVNDDYLQNHWGDYNFQGIGIFAHGRCSHEETMAIVKKADFGILFRQNKRYAKAGFSTKFAECMTNGVAMLCNRVGGADQFIENMVNGIVIENLEQSTLENTLLEIFDLSSESLYNIKFNAWLKAKELFSEEKNGMQLECFVSTIIT